MEAHGLHAGAVTDNQPPAPAQPPNIGYPYPPAPGPGAGAPAAPQVEPAEGWQSAYLKARQRSTMFMIATIGLGITTLLACLLALGFGAWGLSNAGSHRGGTTNGLMDGRGGPFQGPDEGPGQGQGQGRGQRLAQRYFNPDGSLNQAQVEKLKQRIADGDGPDLTTLRTALARGVAAGSITRQQADQLLAALGSVAPAPSTSPATPSATPTPTAVP